MYDRLTAIELLESASDAHQREALHHIARDRLMEGYHAQYPAYRFDRHKGYPTQMHREAVRKYGCCPIHRVTFRGVKEYARSPLEPPE